MLAEESSDGTASNCWSAEWGDFGNLQQSGTVLPDGVSSIWGAPEHVQAMLSRQRHKVPFDRINGPAADMWSCGAVIYYLVSLLLWLLLWCACVHSLQAAAVHKHVPNQAFTHMSHKLHFVASALVNIRSPCGHDKQWAVRQEPCWKSLYTQNTDSACKRNRRLGC